MCFFVKMRTWPAKNLVHIIVFLEVCADVYCGSSGSRNYKDTFESDRRKVVDRSTKHWLCFILGVCSLSRFSKATISPNLNLIYQWKQLEFDYSSPTERQRDIDDGNFAVGEIAPIDVDVYYAGDTNQNEIFITIPKFRSGIPATLGTVTNKMLDGNPIIKPYPNWSWHRNLQNCEDNRLVSVFRTKIDECGRLWVLDTGKIGDDQICSPQLIAFNLRNNQVISRHEFSQSVFEEASLFVTPEVDVRDPESGCRNTFVYIADVTGFAIVVYDAVKNRSWRIEDKTFYPYPNYGTYNIEGDSFELMDGILGLALSPLKPGQDRKLFYHALSSPTENWVYTSNLRNETLFEADPNSSPEIFHTFPQQRRTQTAAEVIDKDDVMFFGLMGDCQIACWNINTEYGPKNWDIIASNTVTLQFPSGLKIIKNRKGNEELFIMTSRFQKIASGTLDPKEINFRIQAGKVDDLLFGTKCRGRRNPPGYPGFPGKPHTHYPPSSGGGGFGLYANVAG